MRNRPITTIKVRPALFVATVVVASAFGWLAAVADTQVIRDANDSAGRLDVKVLRHGHTSTGLLKHTVVCVRAGAADVRPQGKHLRVLQLLR